MDKAALRRQCRERRTALCTAATPDDIARVSAQVLTILASHRLETVAGYFPTHGELDCRPILAALADTGYMTALPAVNAPGLPLVFRAWQPEEPTRRGPYNIPEPLDSAPVLTPDALLVPMLAFDLRGHRLGYGGGYYDRTLAALRANNPDLLAIGIAYAGQAIDAVPAEAHDAMLDAIATERGVIKPS